MQRDARSQAIAAPQHSYCPRSDCRSGGGLVLSGYGARERRAARQVHTRRRSRGYLRQQAGHAFAVQDHDWGLPRPDVHAHARPAHRARRHQGQQHSRGGPCRARRPAADTGLWPVARPYAQHHAAWRHLGMDGAGDPARPEPEGVQLRHLLPWPRHSLHVHGHQAHVQALRPRGREVPEEGQPAHADLAQRVPLRGHLQAHRSEVPRARGRG
mmetsp:Transcript_40988/g.118445  ORF Transcript_40988/g.118445 Transcript_40988/m.118445 type:complete len:213 (+) Transcript_40988:250-888(+)